MPSALGYVNEPAFVGPLIAGGHVGMLLVLLTIFFSRQIMRHAIFVNFCLTWMLFSLSYLLLFYAGEFQNPQPGFSLCVIQAAMVNGAPPIAGFSSFMFVLHIYLVLRRAIFQLAQYKYQTLILAMMISIPYVVFWTVFIIVIIAGTNDPHSIIRTTYYCHSNLSWVAQMTPILSAVSVIGVIITEVMIACTLRQHWHTFRKIGAETGLTLHFMIRALVFTLFAFLALIACGIFLATSESSASMVVFVIAFLPLGVFVVFGTQADLLRAWIPRNKKSIDIAHSHKVGHRSPESLSAV